MQIIENGLIPIYEANQRKVADARELHEFLEVGKDFSTWIKDKIDKYGFIEGEDFSPKLGKSIGGRPSTEYILTLDMAKEIAMVENNERGRQIRKYFIEVEKRVRNLKQMTQAEILAGVAQQTVDIERNLAVLNKKVSNVLKVFTEPPKDDWRHEISKTINRLVETNGLNHQGFRHELYTELEWTARVNLDSRKIRLRERMKTEGATLEQRDAISKLDIVERDPKLKAIFGNIVRKYQAKYAGQEREV